MKNMNIGLTMRVRYESNCITINMKTAFIIKMETYMLDN